MVDRARSVCHLLWLTLVIVAVVSLAVPASSTELPGTGFVLQSLPPPPPPPPFPDPGPTPIVGVWPSNGIVVCDAPGSQGLPAMCDDFAHGAYFVWSDERNAEPDVYATRITAAGVPAAGWPANGIPVCTAPGVQSGIWCGTDDTDGLWVAWLDQRNGYPALYVQRLTSDGQVAPGWPVNGMRVCSATDQNNFSAFTDRMGGLDLTWSIGTAVIAQRLRVDGTPYPGWGACGISTPLPRGTDTNCNQQWTTTYLNSAMAWPDGIFLTTQYNATCSGCHGCIPFSERRVTLVQPTGGGTSPLSTDLWYPAVYSDDMGGVYLIIYLSEMLRNGLGYNPSWTVQLPVFLGSWVHSDGRDGFHVVAYRGSPPFSVSRLETNGSWNPAWSGSAGVPVCQAPCDPVLDVGLSVAVDASRGAFFVWTDERALPAGSTDFRATWIQENGVRGPGWSPDGTRFVTLSAPKQLAPTVSDRRGSAIVGWRDQRAGNWNIYAYRLTTDLPTPVLGNLITATAEPGRVVLEWDAGGSAVPAEVERRDPEGPWVRIASLVSDDSRRVRYEDLSVSTNSRYGYRLLVRGEALGETWLDVPAGLTLGFEEVFPNPSSDGMAVSFTLTRGGDARVSVLDVTGRRIAVEDLRGLGAGRHTRRLTGTSALAPGLYVVELAAEGALARRKAVVSR